MDAKSLVAQIEEVLELVDALGPTYRAYLNISPPGEKMCGFQICGARGEMHLDGKDMLSFDGAVSSLKNHLRNMAIDERQQLRKSATSTCDEIAKLNAALHEPGGVTTQELVNAIGNVIHEGPDPEGDLKRLEQVYNRLKTSGPKVEE